MGPFDGLLFTVSILAGGIASVSGFGIGSLLTPILALKLDTKIAVAAVSVPHLVATSLRFWMLRRHVDKRVLIHFGILSAVGGLLGALLNTVIHPATLTFTFGVILVFAGFTSTTGLNERFLFGPKTAWFAGTLSGLLGGLVGNQGGIRSAALLGFRIDPKTFVGTATAIGVIVDAVRIPVYFVNQRPVIWANKNYLWIATSGAVVGTLVGMRVLRTLPERVFKRIVSSLILILGLFMIFRGMNQ